MAALSDEEVMAYVDGVLDAARRARVEAVVHRDPETQRRVEIFRSTGVQNISPLYGKLEPAPAHLVDFVLQYGKDNTSPAKANGSRESFASRVKKFAHRAFTERFPAAVTWQLAAASVAALIIGAGAGWMLRGGPADDGTSLAAFNRGQILAGGALQHVLDTLPSGQDALIAGKAQEATVVRPSLTFKSKEGGFCREYEVAAGRSGSFSGLACRQASGQWALRIHVLEAGVMPAQKIAPGPAGDPKAPESNDVPPESALDEIVDRMIDGIALGKKEEEALIAHGWK